MVSGGLRLQYSVIPGLTPDRGPGQTPEKPLDSGFRRRDAVGAVAYTEFQLQTCGIRGLKAGDRSGSIAPESNIRGLIGTSGYNELLYLDLFATLPDMPQIIRLLHAEPSLWG